ncbi:DUF2637 domain-containing protein [Streptomyces albidoflavus]|uniref:DUF2637 domain-containing protein n=1 Tax=Streptomyces albidoflavus TaxID=1886 RepID=UPI0033E14941
MNLFHRTRTTRSPSPRATRDWDKALTDGGVYLLAIGGFYVGYQTLLSMALAVGLPRDQAHVVAALIDLAILIYSRKGLREIREGRSAWGIRLIVATFSIATFALQIRAAWPHPVAISFHAAPPLVWIIGHEMMLRGERRNAKRDKRDREVAQGLRPAPLARIRTSHWLLDPYHTFIAWRLTQLWECSYEAVIRHEAQALDAKSKRVPRAWQGILRAVERAPQLHRVDRAPIFKSELHKFALPTPKAPLPLPPLKLLDDQTTEPPETVTERFLHSLPSAPPKGDRTHEDMAAYIQRATQLAEDMGVYCTGRMLATLLDADEGQVSRIRKGLREGKYQQPSPLAAAC